MRLLSGCDRCVVQRRAPVGRALVDGQRGNLRDDGGNDLHAARSRADDGHTLAREVDRRRRPPPGVVRLASEVLASRHLRVVRHGEHARRRHEELRAQLSSVAHNDRPCARRIVVFGRGDAGAEADLAPKVEPVHHMVEVALDLWLLGKVLLPLPFFEQLLREQVGVGVALRVEPSPGIAIPVPRAPDTVACLEELHGETGFAGTVELVDAGDASADHQHVHVRGELAGDLFGCEFGGCHEPPRRSARRGLRRVLRRHIMRSRGGRARIVPTG